MTAPLRVGILNDMSEGPSGARSSESWIRIPVDELIDNGRIDRDVEFVHSYGLGLPSGTAAAVERAFVELVEEDVLLIVGPAIGDNALVATPLADRYGVPTINWAGTERGRSDYMFHLQVGSHEDESIVLARYVASLGARKVGVVHDRSPIGRRHLSFFQDEADVLGIQVAASSVSPLAEEAGSETDAVLDLGVDAILYLGLGLAVPAVARAVTARGWQGPRAMNTCGMRGYAPEFGQVIDGWVYVDMHSDANTTLAEVRRRTGTSVDDGRGVAFAFDLGQLAAEGLARATERTRDGVREGLENIKWLSAAEGMQGTLLGFGHVDHGALHGRYLVLRRWEAGHSVEVSW